MTSKSLQYWIAKPATIDGVLGGYGALTEIDLRDSRAFFAQLKKSGKTNRAADLGAGVGRVTTGLLVHIAETIDLYEPVEKMRIQAEKDLAAKGLSHRTHVYAHSLQTFTEVQTQYDLIWLQWCTLYATDEEFVGLLKHCASLMTPGGLIVLKENISEDGDIHDEEDDSYIRTNVSTLKLIEKAGLRCSAQKRQRNWPKDLYTVEMYAIEKI